MASVFGVATATFYNWQKSHPKFVEAIKRGKETADANVASRLYERAMGYSHEAVKIVADAKTGSEHIVPFTEHYPPDTTAAIFWLKNRQRAKWRDVNTHAGDPENPIVLAVTEAKHAFESRIASLAARDGEGDDAGKPN